MEGDPEQSPGPRFPGGSVHLALGSTLMLASCAGSCDEVLQGRKQTGTQGPGAERLVLGLLLEPTTLDPAYVSNTPGREVLALVHRGLLRFDAQGSVQPWMAASVPTATVSPRGAAVQWTLAPAFWSDGIAVTTEDVKFGWHYDRSAEDDPVNRHFARMVSDIGILGPRRFVVRWSEPNIAAVSPGAHTILPAHAYPPSNGIPVGNGPYRVASWERGVQMELEPNPFWPGSPPGIRNLTVRFHAQQDALFLALVSGRVQAVGEGSLSSRYLPVLRERLAETHVIHTTDGGAWLHLVLSAKHPVTSAPAFRRVLHAALDRGALAKLSPGGGMAPVTTLFPRSHPAHRPGIRPAPPREDDRRRVEALANHEAPLVLQISGGSERSASLATVLREQIRGLGFEVRIDTVEFSVLNQRLRAGTAAPMVLYAWRTRPDWDARSVLRSDGRQNFSGFRDADVDRWLDEAERASDRELWKAILHQVEQRFLERLPLVPLLQPEQISVRPRWLEGWEPTGTTTPVTWNAEHWRVVRDGADPPADVPSTH